jgi:hypothetical protein
LARIKRGKNPCIDARLRFPEFLPPRRFDRFPCLQFKVIKVPQILPKPASNFIWTAFFYDQAFGMANVSAAARGLSGEINIVVIIDFKSQ